MVEGGWALQIDDVHNADNGKVPVRARGLQDLGHWLRVCFQLRF